MPRYAELQVTTNFSFLRGASHGEELVAQAKALGLEALAVTDRNTLAGVVRAHTAAKEVGLRLIVGARLDLQDAPSLLCLPRDRQAYGRLSPFALAGPDARQERRMHALSRGRRAARRRPDLHRAAPRRLGLARGAGRTCRRGAAPHRCHHPVHLSAAGSKKFSPSNPVLKQQGFEAELRRIKAVLEGSPLYLAASHTYRGDDRARIAALDLPRQRCATPLVATGDVLYHAPHRRAAAGCADVACARARRSPSGLSGSRPMPSGT